MSEYVRSTLENNAPPSCLRDDLESIQFVDDELGDSSSPTAGSPDDSCSPAAVAPAVGSRDLSCDTNGPQQPGSSGNVVEEQLMAVREDVIATMEDLSPEAGGISDDSGTSSISYSQKVRWFYVFVGTVPYQVTYRYLVLFTHNNIGDVQ
jgi:hypothetical protein